MEMLRCNISAVCCSNFLCRSRPIRASSPFPKNSRAKITMAAISSWTPSPRAAEIPNSVGPAAPRKPLADSRGLAALARFEIDLVSHNPRPRNAVAIGYPMLRIDHPQYEVRLFRTRARPAHPLLLDGIIGLANAGGVDHRYRIAVEIELDLDHVAGGAGMRGDDRHLASRQLIYQRRFADVRRTRDRHHQPVA